MILKPSLSFAGPREYRWQGLEVPAMMGKRRGTAQITTAVFAFCAGPTKTQYKQLKHIDLVRLRVSSIARQHGYDQNTEEANHDVKHNE
jgi:hypothetical protein